MCVDDKHGHDKHMVMMEGIIWTLWEPIFVCVGGSGGVIIPSTSEMWKWRDGLWLKAVAAFVEVPAPT